MGGKVLLGLSVAEQRGAGGWIAAELELLGTGQDADRFISGECCLKEGDGGVNMVLLVGGKPGIFNHVNIGASES